MLSQSPGFDIHYFPVEGVGRDVCADILDFIFQLPEKREDLPSAQIEELLKNIQIDYAVVTRKL